MKLLRNLYNWVLHWSHTRYGTAALFLLAFSESSFFPVPPDALLIALVLGSTKKAFRFATVCLMGSVAGALLGYVIGHFLWWTPQTSSLELLISSSIIFRVLLPKNFSKSRIYTLNMTSG